VAILNDHTNDFKINNLEQTRSRRRSIHHIGKRLGLNHPGRISDHDATGGDVFGDDASRADYRSVPNSDAADNDGMGSNPYIIAYDRIFGFSARRRNRVFAANYDAIEQGDVRADEGVSVDYNSPPMNEKEPGTGTKPRRQVDSCLGLRKTMQESRNDPQRRQFSLAPLAQSKRKNRPKGTARYCERQDRTNR
jgi:hypothetical protein